LPSETYDQIAQMSEQQSNPSEQLKQLEAFKDDFTFEQTESEYVLELSTAGEKFNALIEEKLNQVMNADYSNYNGHSTKDVLNTAQELQL
jgi:hypothetical protein